MSKISSTSHPVSIVASKSDETRMMSIGRFLIAPNLTLENIDQKVTVGPKIGSSLV